MLSELINSNLNSIANTIFLSFLVLIGGRLNKQFHKLTKKINVVIRITLFVAFSVLGYALLAKYGTSLTLSIITLSNGQYSDIIVVGMFIMIGVVAEKLKYGK